VPFSLFVEVIAFPSLFCGRSGGPSGLMKRRNLVISSENNQVKVECIYFLAKQMQTKRMKMSCWYNARNRRVEYQYAENSPHSAYIHLNSAIIVFEFLLCIGEKLHNPFFAHSSHHTSHISRAHFPPFQLPARRASIWDSTYSHLYIAPLHPHREILL